MILVTGASRGLGNAIAQRILDSGEDVLGIARNTAGLTFPAVSCDVLDLPALKGIAKSIRQRGQVVTGLINAAGVASMNLALTTPTESAQHIVGVNLLGTVNSIQAFTPLMVRQKFGRIVNFSSIAVSLGLAGEAIYVASKAGVEGFSRAFAREVSDFGITVNCIAPGPIRTDLLRGISDKQIAEIVSRQIIRKEFSPEDVCDLVELLLDSRSQYLSGHVLTLGGS